MAHRARPGADHLLRRSPAFLDDAQRVDQLGLPIRAPARLAPGKRGECGKHRPRVVLLHDRIAERRLDAPQAEDDSALDAEILLDPREQRRVGLRALLSGLNAPVGDAAVEILPELLVEL